MTVTGVYWSAVSLFNVESKHRPSGQKKTLLVHTCGNLFRTLASESTNTLKTDLLSCINLRVAASRTASEQRPPLGVYHLYESQRRPVSRTTANIMALTRSWSTISLPSSPPPLTQRFFLYFCKAEMYFVFFWYILKATWVSTTVLNWSGITCIFPK